MMLVRFPNDSIEEFSHYSDLVEIARDCCNGEEWVLTNLEYSYRIKEYELIQLIDEEINLHAREIIEDFGCEIKDAI